MPQGWAVLEPARSDADRRLLMRLIQGQNEGATSNPSMSAPAPGNSESARNRILLLQRAPRRISVNVSHELFCRLQALADQQGRSTSNLCAYILEAATAKPAAAAMGSARRADAWQRGPQS